MGARAHSQPLAIGPVAKIVPADVARPREVGDIILEIARGLQPVPSLLIHIGQRIFVIQIQSPSLHLPVKMCPLFDRQPIEGEMLGRQGDRSVEIGPPAGKGLAWEPVDQVQVQVGKVSPASGTDSLHDLPGRMRGVGRFQLRIVERLCAQAKPVEPALPERS